MCRIKVDIKMQIVDIPRQDVRLSSLSSKSNPALLDHD